MLFLQRLLATRAFLFGIETAPAMPGTTKAVGGIVEISVVEVVVVGEFLARRNVADGSNENPAIDFIRLAIRIAGMVDESRDAIAVNHPLAIGQTKEICPRRMLVNVVGLIVGQLRAGVFDDNVALFNRSGSVHTIGMDLGSADNQCHKRRCTLPVQVFNIISVSF